MVMTWYQPFAIQGTHDTHSFKIKKAKCHKDQITPIQIELSNSFIYALGGLQWVNVS